MAEMLEGPKDESPEGVTAKAARFFRTFGFIAFLPLLEGGQGWYKKKQSRRYSGTVKKFVLNLTKKEQGSSGGTNFKLSSKDAWIADSGFCLS